MRGGGNSVKRQLAGRAFTRLAMAVRRLEQPGRHFFAVRQADGTIEIIRRVGTVSTPIGVVLPDFTLAPGTFISAPGGLVDQRAELRGILDELRGAA